MGLRALLSINPEHTRASDLGVEGLIYKSFLDKQNKCQFLLTLNRLIIHIFNENLSVLCTKKCQFFGHWSQNVQIAMKDMEDRLTHKHHITAEALRDDIKQVAYGVMNLNEKFDREMSQFRKEVACYHEE